MENKIKIINNKIMEDKKMKLVKLNHDPLFPVFFNRFFNDNMNFINTTNEMAPATNILEKDGGYEIDFAAPGFEKKDFNINLSENILTISSEKKGENEEKNKNFTRREFTYGSFSRSFTLPENVDNEKISATYENGILKVEIPLKEEAKTQLSRQISIS